MQKFLGSSFCKVLARFAKPKNNDYLHLEVVVADQPRGDDIAQRIQRQKSLLHVRAMKDNFITWLNSNLCSHNCPANVCSILVITIATLTNGAVGYCGIWRIFRSYFECWLPRSVQNFAFVETGFVFV
jgi:hypothetical protein